MIGWTLGRYFLRRYTITTMWFFAGIGALAFLVDFTEFSRKTGALPDYNLLTALATSAFRLPIIMVQVVPFIALFSAMATLIALNRRYELVVARSAGVSAWQFLLPACAGAFIFGVLTVTIVNPLGAAGLSRAENIEALWRSGKSNEISAFKVPWLRQITDEGETFIGAHSILAQGTVLVDAVFIHIGKDGSIVQRDDAERAVLNDGYWLLKNVRRSRDGREPEAIDQVRVSTNLRKEFVTEGLARPETVSFFDLPEKIKVAEGFGFSANSFRMYYHSLIALPVLLMSMTLIAATVSLKFVRLGQSIPMILGGVAAGFLLYVVSVLVKAFGDAGFVSPVIAAWFPVVIAAFFGISFLLHKEDG